MKLLVAYLTGLMALATLTPACSQEVRASSADERYTQLTRFIDTTAGRALSRDDTADYGAIAAMGWISGVYETMGVSASIDPRLGICTSTSIPLTTMARLYTNYMDQHPESHQYPAALVAVLSARAAYPCKPKP